MRHTVTVRGSLSPAAGVLERGAVKTFEYSEKVQGWIDKGYVDLLSEELPQSEPVPKAKAKRKPKPVKAPEPPDERTDTEREADEQAAEAENDYAQE